MNLESTTQNIIIQYHTEGPLWPWVSEVGHLGPNNLAVMTAFRLSDRFIAHLLFEQHERLYPVLDVEIQDGPDSWQISLPAWAEPMRETVELLNQVVARIQANRNRLGILPTIVTLKPTSWLGQFLAKPRNAHRTPLLGLTDLWTHRRTLRLYEEIARWLKGKAATVVDLGCGAGLGAMLLTVQGFSVWGVEADQDPLDIAKRLGIPTTCPIRWMNLEDLAAHPSAADAVVCVEVLEHLSGPELGLKTILQTVKSDSWVAISLPNWVHHGMDLNSDHRTDWTWRRVEQVLGPLFDVKHRAVVLHAGWPAQPQIQQLPVTGVREEDCENYLVIGQPRQERRASRPWMRAPRILLVCHGYPPGEWTGTPLRTRRYAEALATRGFFVSVMTAKRSGQVEYERQDQVAVYRVPVFPFASLTLQAASLTDRQVLKPYADVMEQVQPDVVHIIDLVGMPPQIYHLAKTFGARVIRHVCNDEDLCLRISPVIAEEQRLCPGPVDIRNCLTCADRLIAHVEQNPVWEARRRGELAGRLVAYHDYMRWIFREQIDTVIFAAESFCEHVRQFLPIPPEKIRIIPASIGTPSLVGWGSGIAKNRHRRLKIGFLGAITFHKGVDVLIRALSQIDPARWELVVYGQPVDPVLVSRLGQFPNTTVHGAYQPGQLPAIAEQIDLAIVPSYFESYCFTLREWLACRVPVIATRFFGSEIIHEGINGFVVDIGDADQLAARINLLLDEPDWLACLRAGAAGTRLITLDEEINELITCYDLDGSEPWDKCSVEPAALSHVGSQPPKTCTCSIIIPVWNKVELTRQCLTSLASVTQDVDYEVILVDNASTDETPVFLATLGGDVQVLRNEENLGFAKACNQGARASGGRYLVFLNNDTIPQLGWLKALVDEVEAHPEVAVVGSKLLYPNDTIQHAGVVFSRIFGTPYHLYNGFPADAPVVNQCREFQVVTAACMLVRREVFEAVEGFDEGYRNGFEDVDLCLKIREQGGRVVYQPKSVLYHLESQTPGRKDHDAANGRRLLERWESRWLTDEDTIYVPDGYAIRMSHESGRLSYHLTALTGRDENARWERVAEVERQGHAGNMDVVRALLAQPDLWPHDSGVLRWAAQICDRTGVPSYAEAFWRRVLDFGETPDVLVALTRLSLEKGALDEAEQYVQELITQIPTHSEGWLLQGILALQRQDFLKAKFAFEDALRHDNNSRKARKGLGMAAMGLGQMHIAWEMFATVLAEESDDAEVIHSLLRAGTALERWQPLADSLCNYLKCNPGDLSVRFALAGVQIRLGDWEAAHGHYEMIRLLEPTFAGLDDLAQILKTGNIGADV